MSEGSLAERLERALMAEGAMDSSICSIKRVDDNKRIVGESSVQDMAGELEQRKRAGSVMKGLEGCSVQEKLTWALAVKEEANSEYNNQDFKTAAQLYTDCLCALDMSGSTESSQQMKYGIQLPVTTNLAACMLEEGKYRRCIELCNLAVEIDHYNIRAIFRRATALFRLDLLVEAKADFRMCLKLLGGEERVKAKKDGKDTRDGGAEVEQRGIVKTEEQTNGGGETGRSDEGNGALQCDAVLGKLSEASIRDMRKRIALYLKNIEIHETKQKEMYKNIFAENNKMSLYEEKHNKFLQETASLDFTDCFGDSAKTSMSHWIRNLFSICSRRKMK